jgi:hypothetical protein
LIDYKKSLRCYVETVKRRLNQVKRGAIERSSARQNLCCSEEEMGKGKEDEV